MQLAVTNNYEFRVSEAHMEAYHLNISHMSAACRVVCLEGPKSTAVLLPAALQTSAQPRDRLNILVRRTAHTTEVCMDSDKLANNPTSKRQRLSPRAATLYPGSSCELKLSQQTWAAAGH